MSLLAASTKVWKEKRTHYPFFAQSSTSLKPDAVNHETFGHFVACVFSRGTRSWMFKTQADRDRFVNHFRNAYSAEPCKDPVR